MLPFPTILGPIIHFIDSLIKRNINEQEFQSEVLYQSIKNYAAYY